MKYQPNIKANKMLDYLLNKKFFHLENYLKSEFNADNRSISNEIDITPTAKKIKLNENSNQIFNQNEIMKDVILCCSKFNKYVDINKIKFKTNNNNITDIKYKWKFDTKKCVDATPLLVVKPNQTLVLIGSHSHQFVCLNGINGKLLWSFNAKDRIESSACLSKCGKYAIFGSYDCSVYFIRLEDGVLEWRFETNDVVKSSPCVNFDNGYVYFGSHDKNLYCLDFEVFKDFKIYFSLFW